MLRSGARHRSVGGTVQRAASALVLASIIMLGGQADAQQQAPSQPSAVPAPAPAMPAPAPTAAPAPAAAPAAAAKPASADAADTPATVIDDKQIESILGRPVQSPTAEDMGRIVDILVDKTGKLRAAVIDFGGFFGVGSRKIAVDWHSLHFKTGGKADAIVTDLPPNQLRKSPVYKEGEPVVVLGPAAAPDAKPAADVQPAAPAAAGAPAPDPAPK